METLIGALDDACYRTVHDYLDPNSKARGATALAPRVGMQPGTLSNKTNPLQDHQLGLRESIPLQLISGDYRILSAYAAALGHVAWRLPTERHISDVALLDSYANVHAEAGLMAQQVRRTLRDQKITSAEVAELRRLFGAQVAAGLELIARFEALADDA